MWISKKKYEDKIDEIKMKSWEESRHVRYEDRQNEKTHRLEQDLKELKKQVKKLEKYIKEGY
jgi:hypothetical protein